MPDEGRPYRLTAAQGAVVAALAMSAACASAPPRATLTCGNADGQLAALLGSLEQRRSTADGCAPGRAAVDCQRLRDAVDRLSMTCDTHVPTLLANALLSYDEGRRPRSQQLLDMVFALQPNQADAGALRARLALEDGNVPYALKLTADQLSINPAHAGLHEARAGALFVAGRLDEASGELTIAANLGAPAWRVAYDRGLVAEAAGQVSEAQFFFEKAVAARPGWAPAAERLKALKARSP